MRSTTSLGALFLVTLPKYLTARFTHKTYQTKINFFHQAIQSNTFLLRAFVFPVDNCSRLSILTEHHLCKCLAVNQSRETGVGIRHCCICWDMSFQAEICWVSSRDVSAVHWHVCRQELRLNAAYLHTQIHLQCMACRLKPDSSVHDPSTTLHHLISVVWLIWCSAGLNLATTKSSSTRWKDGYQIVLLIVQQDTLLSGHVLGQCMNKMVL